MSSDCLQKPCQICGKPIQGANFYCSRCKACICFYCGAELMRDADLTKLKCPRCGETLK